MTKLLIRKIFSVCLLTIFQEDSIVVSISASISDSVSASSSSGASPWCKVARGGNSNKNRRNSNRPFGLKVKDHYEKAKKLASIEQEVEDYNARWVALSKNQAEATAKRRLICLPLDERFDPPMGVFSHGHVQTGDKISLPKCLMNSIRLNNAEVPWLFKVSRIDDDDDGDSNNSRVDVDVVSKGYAAEANIKDVVGGPLDHGRAPSNYCFLPLWMMRALGLKPLDQVDVQLITTVPPGSFVKLRPHSSSFTKDITNTQAVLETELRHYSSLTKGAVIPFDYNGKRYWFDVEELRSAPKGEKQSMVKLQDCDVATDFLIAKDIVAERKRKKEEARRAQLEAEEEEKGEDENND